ncbi:xanthine dehydrogenase family protein subunit M [Bordetella sp. BOR01]|uniref:FAD binding domain-containing protein n=1 Tax=Bordetella sp. BOR01 TaxID=2854779 RepID=UPI001C492AF2|nr:FAD binding domain-containing protein [Bordetella sp. BOR01]MBV7485591.1 FAD binding domain-containing protein [Bordetella sp. BOR01]
MKAARFDYVRAGSVAQAVELLREHEGRAKLMAGGQSLGPMLNLRLARPAVVIDIAGLAELRTVTEQEGGLRVGAGVTHAELEDGVHPLLRGSALQHVAGGIAYRAIRNRGTVGGSLAHADPAADWVLTMVALGAQIEIAGPAGSSRRVAAGEFMQGAYTTAVGDDELIAAVHVPRSTAQARWGYYKFCRKTGEFAEASCAAWFDPAAKVARVAVGALNGAPALLPVLAAQVAQSGMAPADDKHILDELAGVMPDKDPLHRKLHATAVARCLAQALAA